MSYEITFRNRTLAYLSKGNTLKHTAETFGISTSTLNSWIVKNKAGDLLCKKRKQWYRKIDYDALKDYIDEHPDVYQGEVAQHFHCSQQCVCYAMKGLVIHEKKDQTL